MAAPVPYNGGVPEREPGPAPGVAQTVHSTPADFGAAVGQGLEQMGASFYKANAIYEQAAADDAFNKLVTDSDRIRKGDPSKTQTGPNGEVIQVDTGYMNLKGADALRAREPTLQEIDQRIKFYGDGITNPQAKKNFQRMATRARSQWFQEIGSHAGREERVWASGVNQTTANQALDRIASGYDNDEEFKHGEADYIDATVKATQLQVGTMTPEQTAGVVKTAKAKALQTRIMATTAKDPGRAMDLLEQNREMLGTDYAPMYEKIRARADQVDGPLIGDEEMNRRGANAKPSSQQVAGAIWRQESGNRDNINDSTDGAIGPGQVMPGTFKQWAQPGEDIRNPADNRRVSQRMIDSYHKQYNGDPARIAVAYFSGPGNVAPEGSETPWKQDRKDGNGKYVSSYVNDIMKKLGGESGEMRGPLPPKSEAVERILKRTQGNPGLRNAALAHANMVYSLYNTENAALKAQTVQRENDTLTEASRTGAAKNPMVAQDFVDVYGEDAGVKRYGEYQKGLQLAADVQTLGSMGPAERNELMKKYEPEAGSEGYAAQSSRQDALVKAVTQLTKEMSSDPGEYALRRLPAAQAAYQAMTEVQKNPQAKPEEKQAAAANFARVTMMEQERVGIAASDRAILPKPIVESIGQEIMTPSPDGQPANVAANIEKQAQLWGQHWPEVYRQIQKDAQPIVRVIGSGIKPQAATILTANAAVPANKILDDTEEKMATVKKEVRSEFGKFAATLAGAKDQSQIFNDFQGQAEKLASFYVRGGMTVADATDKAFDDMLGFKYHFYGSNGIFGTNWNTGDRIRVPKSEPVPLADIVEGMKIVRNSFKPEDFAAPRDTVGGLTPGYLGHVKPSAYQRDGVWVTAPGDVGLMLVYNDQAVRGKDGQPVIRTWKQLGEVVSEQRNRAKADVLSRDQEHIYYGGQR